MFATLIAFLWMIKNDHWHPEEATTDAYGFGLVLCGLGELVIWGVVLWMISKYIGII